MLVDFTVKNYLSIKDEVTLSFLSNNKNVCEQLKLIPVEEGRYNLYSFSAIFGPNASGKTNLIKALSDFISFIVLSHRLDLDKKIPIYKPFVLDKENLDLPVGFDIEFVAEGTRYAYSIEVNRNEIIKEVLDFYPEARKANLFQRYKGKKIKYGTYFTGEKKSIETFLLPNRLMLSVSANSNNEILKPVYRFFRDAIDIHVRMDSAHSLFHRTTHDLRDREDEFKKLLLKILSAADLNIKDIRLDEDEHVTTKLRLPDDMPEDLQKQIMDDVKYRPYLGHSVFDRGVKTEELKYFDLDDEESSGTIKMYDLAGEILSALNNGTVLIIDEFNSGLHPLLNKFLVELFVDPNINKKNAQLLISTHDTCVLDLSILKREQVWFTDKNEIGATELFSLDEFDKNLVRDNAKYSKYYLDGRFKAVPATNAYELLSELL